MKIFVLLLSFIVSIKAIGAIQKLEITLESGSGPEKTAKALIEDFAKKYDLLNYYFTGKIHIQSFVIPHSHPVLTLNTRTIKEPDRYLALFIHEQIHWFFDLNGRAEKTKVFIEKMKKQFPKVPSQQEGGAKDDESTYLHLGVCFYELEQLSKLIGKEKAEQTFKTDEIYSWVRKQVLDKHDIIQSALTETGLSWQDAGEL
ncbi:MAG: hypothetical protein ACXWC9_11760 [Pseudobdellovibrionaceae bacterium]